MINESREVTIPLDLLALSLLGFALFQLRKYKQTLLANLFCRF